MALTLVSTVTVGSGGAASIEFTGIPQTGKDLLVVYSLRTNEASDFTGALVSINGTANFANFEHRRLFGNGSTVASNTGRDLSVNGTATTSNVFTNGSVYIANYTLTNASKSISVDWVAENNATASQQQILAMRHTLNDAITSTGIGNAGNFVQHSTASLYIIS